MMKRFLSAILFLVVQSAANSTQADLVVSLFRTGDITRSSSWSVTPGEVFSIDAEIHSTSPLPGDLLNSYFAEFTSTPLDASAALFTDQFSVAPYRNSAADYVFGDAEVLGGVTSSSFLSVFDGALPGISDVTIGSTPLLLARMELVADITGTPGDRVVIELDTSATALTTFLSGSLTPVNIASATPATVTFSAVPEPSTVLLLVAGTMFVVAGKVGRRGIFRSRQIAGSQSVPPISELAVSNPEEAANDLPMPAWSAAAR
ncbi:MAG: PEP-CTERM sorting domain-containing protein [Planctomycetaceae bacterium]